MQSLLFIILLINCVSSNQQEGTDHAIYIGVVDINKNDQRISLKVKVFTDDLEDALQNEFGKKIVLSDEKSCFEQVVNLEGYFLQHLKIQINRSDYVYKFRGCEKLEDAIWLSFEGPCPAQWKEISITADFLTELFPTQTNIINLSRNGKKHFLRLTNNKASGKIIFD